MGKERARRAKIPREGLIGQRHTKKRRFSRAPYRERACRARQGQKGGPGQTGKEMYLCVTCRPGLVAFCGHMLGNYTIMSIIGDWNFADG